VAQIVGAILLIGLFIYAFQLALILLIVAGLIFRTKETVGLLLILAIFAGLRAAPLVGLGLLVLFVVAAIVKAVKKAPKEKAIDGPEQE